MEKIIRKNLIGETYTEYVFKTDFGEFTLWIDPDSGYTMFDVKSKGEPNDIKTYFGLNKEDSGVLGLILLGEQK